MGSPILGGLLSFLLTSLRTYVKNHLKMGNKNKIQPSKSFVGDNIQLVLKLDTLPDDLKYPPIYRQDLPPVNKNHVKCIDFRVKVATWGTS